MVRENNAITFRQIQTKILADHATFRNVQIVSLSALDRIQAVEQAGLQYCTVLYVYRNKTFFAAYLCAVLCLTMEKSRPTLRHFTKGEMAHSPESLSFMVFHFDDCVFNFALQCALNAW